MSVKKFMLLNEYAQTYDLSLNKKDTMAFISTPKGMGWSKTGTYVSIGDSFLQTDMETSQGEITGTILCDSYKIFREFANFVAKSKTLKLVYKCVENDGIYYRDIDTVKLEKAEIGGSDKLSCGITFKCKTLYYQEETVVYMVVADETDRRYPIPYPNKYADFSSRSDVLVNDGHRDASISFTVYGYCEQPQITISSDEVLFDITFDITLQLGEMLKYSSQDGNIYINKIDASGTVTNLIDTLDITNDNFIRIPVGSYTINFTSLTGVDNQTTYVIHKFYEVV